LDNPDGFFLENFALGRTGLGLGTLS